MRFLDFFVGGFVYVKINQAFFAKPVFGPWYFFVRCQSRDFAKNTGSSSNYVFFDVLGGALYMLKK